MVYISSRSPIVAFEELLTWRDEYKTIYSDVQFMMKFKHCLLNLLARSLTRWETDLFDYLDILMKDSVGTNWMLSGEGTLPVSLLPPLLPLHINTVYHYYTMTRCIWCICQIIKQVIIERSTYLSRPFPTAVGSNLDWMHFEYVFNLVWSRPRYRFAIWI